MSAEHTQGAARVATVLDEPLPCVVMVGARELCECYEDGEPQTAEDAANARRIVACWNACQGISTENLEADGIRAAMKLSEEVVASAARAQEELRTVRLQLQFAGRLMRQSIGRRPMAAATYHAIKAFLVAARVPA